MKHILKKKKIVSFIENNLIVKQDLIGIGFLTIPNYNKYKY